jgi:NDP-sugar pyrophosphorylase family protein
MPALALLAGGLATRLRAVTSAVPKAMVKVAGKPFIEHQLRLLAREHVKDVVICTGHLGDQIETFVRDGADFGCRVRYSHDGASLLGTGGAIRKALQLLGPRFFIMYGDSYLDTSFQLIYDAFLRSGKSGLLTVFRNDNRWDTSNVEYANGFVLRFDKSTQTPAMKYIDYGIGLFDAAAFCGVPADRPYDLANLYSDLARRGLLAGYEVSERFYEIGSPTSLAETDAYLSRMPATT